ncbi:MAG: 3-hydroxyacyl-CoA dehydrogenase NAD-binding domain-containing protein, partial [Tannerellaceae bacterium]
MHIAIVGTGYVGLVTGTCFAEMGVDVTCVDIDKEKVDKLRKGVIPIYEPGLETLVLRNADAGRLKFATSLEDIIDDVQIVFIAVGTPPQEDGSADLQYVLDVAHQIGNSMSDYLLVVNKSTVPVGTAQKVKAAIHEALVTRGLEIPFDV